MKDAVVIGPVLLAGSFALNGLSEVNGRPDLSPVPYLLFLVVLAGVLLAWYRMKIRSTERLKTRDLGFDRPGPSAKSEWLGPSAAAVAIGVVGPVGVCTVAWLTTLTTGEEPGVIWGVAGLLGVTSLMCSSSLLKHQQPALASADRAAKPPAFDPDSFDLVGRRS